MERPNLAAAAAFAAFLIFDTGFGPGTPLALQPKRVASILDALTGAAILFQSLLTRFPHLGRLYRGELSPGWSFWFHSLIVGVNFVPFLALLLGGLVATIIFSLGAYPVTGDPTIDADTKSTVLAASLVSFYAASQLYLYIAVVGTWRSADAVQAAAIREGTKRPPSVRLAKAGIVLLVGLHVWGLTLGATIDNLIQLARALF